MKGDVLDQGTLERCVRRFAPDADPITFWRVATGKFNASYFARSGDQEWVLRIAPPSDTVFVFYERGMMRQEPAIHARLLQETTVPVPRILGYDGSCTVLDRAYLLMERMPGRALCETIAADEDAVYRQVGECLAQAHGLTAEHYGYLGEHKPMAPQPSWTDAFTTMWRKLIDDVTATGWYSQEDAARLLALLDRYLPVFERQVPSSLLHMDVWSQNILVSDDGRLTGLVDWDRALWGDPEIEFAVLDYCGVSTPAFWEGYGQRRDASAEAVVRHVFYLLYEVQKYIVIEHGRNHNPRAAQEYKQHVFQIAQRSGLIG